ncbi:MAG: hypothetical protein EOP09_00260 [Proteobacteria bacterium]|nr:MAG: hypothetical protein EOP09_00260 [Pseudomonadota bacterium]
MSKTPLAELTEFDPRVFLPNDIAEKEVAAVVLMLAHIFNDFKTYLWMYELIKTEAPKGRFKRTPEWGECHGKVIHIQRVVFSMIHEVLMLIDAEKKTIESSRFNELISKCSVETRKHWNGLVAVGLNRSNEDVRGSKKFLSALERIRSNTTYHYDQPKDLRNGFKAAFEPIHEIRGLPCSSLGSRMETSRFYFADAAAQELVLSILKPLGQNAGDHLMNLVKNINLSFRKIVEAYIKERTEELEISE